MCTKHERENLNFYFKLSNLIVAVEEVIVALDVGGANIKASSFTLSPNPKLTSVKLYYPIWIKGVEGLAAAIRRAIEMLGCSRIEAAALTMTAELSDIFKDKREGVEAVVKASLEALGDLKVVTVRGNLLNPDEAAERYMEVAAANWWCVGWLASMLYGDCVLVDVGSTTTTITPVVGGVAARGLNDVEKMKLGEIVYVGSLRTPISSIVRCVPLAGSWCRVASEYFANTADVNLVLGYISEGEYDVDTPDGRGRGLADCHNRISRAVCADEGMLNFNQTRLIARFVHEKLVEAVFDGLCQVLSWLAERDLEVSVGVAAGLGDFIASKAIERVGLDCKLIRSLVGRENSIALTSASLAVYLAYRMGVDVERWISSLR
ncbi:MAG: hypothetical protein DRJ62_00085 [Thermoprotei archaeon]|nr:MAG: hypothetical protein DRJ62_00085 [Thermoprotei archaeon]